MNTSENLDAASVLANVGWVRSLALQVAGHSVSSDDVAQETWLRVLRNPPPKGVPMGDWIAGTARKVLVELSRQSRRRKERETIVAKAARNERESETRRQVEIERNVVESVMGLNEPLRQTVLSRYFESMSAREIAVRDKVPVSTVNSRLSAAYAKLRDRLTERPDSVAGAFFCLAIKDTTKATSATAVATGAVTSKPALLAASFIAIASIGVFATRSEPSGRTEVLPLTWAAQSTASTEVMGRDAVPAIDHLPEVSRTRKASSVALEPLVAGAGASPEPIATVTTIAGTSLSVRVLDHLGEPVPEAPFMVRLQDGPITARPVYGKSGSSGDAGVVDFTSFIERSDDPDAQLELMVVEVGFESTPLLLGMNDVPTGTIDLVITRPFGAVMLECVDSQGIALKEDVEIWDLNRDLFLTQREPPTVEAGTTQRIFPVWLNQSSTLIATAKAGYGLSIVELTGPTVHRGINHQQIEFPHRFSTVAFNLSLTDAASLGSRGKWTTEFQADGSEDRRIDKLPWLVDDTHFVSTFTGDSLAGRTGTLTIGWAPRSAGSRNDDGPAVPMNYSLAVTFPTMEERLDLGEIQLDAVHPQFQGRVVNTMGDPMKRARVVVLEWKVEFGVEGWYETREQRITTSSDGTFPCPAVPSTGQFALMAKYKGELASQPLPWNQDDREVVLELQPASTITGQLVLPDGAESLSFQVRAVPPDGGSARVVTCRPKDDGTFSLLAVAGKAVSLEVTTLRTGAPLARLENVPVSGDPRLHPWSLEEELQIHVFRVEDENGELLQGAVAVRTQQAQFYGRDGLVSLMTKTANDLVTVNSKGYREWTGRLENLPPVITMRRGYEVRLEIHAGPETAPLLDTLVVGLERTKGSTLEELALLSGDEWTREASKQAWAVWSSIANDGPTQLVCQQPGEYDLVFRQKVGENARRSIDRESLPTELQRARVVVKDIEGVQAFRFDWR